MKAVVYTNYGPPDVLRIEEIEKPKPKSDEVLIEVHASTVNRTDNGLRSANYFVSRFFTGLFRPKYTTSGSEFAGIIVEVGTGVTDYKVGDKVFGFDDVHGGAHAEYVTKPTNGPFTLMPDGTSYAEMAASGEGATYAWNIIRAAGITKDMNVLVYGASGAIGSSAVQIVKYLGADVTAVCGTKNIERVSKLGADKVVDYETEDFTRTNEKFDLVLDAVGKSSYGVCKKLLNQKGKYISSELGIGGQNPLLAIWFAMIGSRKVMFPIPKINKEIVELIREMIEAGAFKPLIDRTYSIDDIVEAAKYVDTGQKVGNVVIKIV